MFRQLAKNLTAEKFETSFQQAAFGASLSGIIRNLISFKPADADIYHITGDINYLALKLPPEKTVLTIHDLSILHYRKGLRRWVLKKLLFDLPARRMKYVTVISQATRDELVKQTGCEPEKIRIINNPLDDRMKSADKPAFNTGCPNILQVGTLPYKNVPNLIKAIEGLSCTLTLVGEPDEETSRLLSEKKVSYRNEKTLDADAMREAYRTADIVTFCSVFEGFGLPIIEAQAMRTPVVTSNLEPMKSVAGGGALLVDPRNPAEIRQAVERIIQDAGLREELVKRGLDNIKQYDPAAIAKIYAELYEEIIHS